MVREGEQYLSYMAREGDHYLLFLDGKWENTTCYVYMLREREHYLLCLYGKGGRALLSMLIW